MELKMEYRWYLAVILICFLERLAADSIYFTPKTGIIETKPTGNHWSNAWQILPLESNQSPMDLIFDGQWADTFYRENKPNGTISDWINNFKVEHFTEGNPLEDLLRCIGVYPDGSGTWNHNTYHGIQVTEPCNEDIVTLDFSNFPFDSSFAIKIYGATWECLHDDMLVPHQCSLPNGFIFRKKTSSKNLCKIHLNHSNMPRCFTLEIQGPGIGSGNLRQWGSLVYLYYVPKIEKYPGSMDTHSVLLQNL
jgi:hypothetical protein